jgi:4-hydroxy-tetrahydrodipicolinate synthase
VALSPELIARLRKAWPGVITGIKDSSGDWATAERYLASHGDLSVLVGDERLLPRAMARGAEGSICGVANITPGAAGTGGPFGRRRAGW